MGVVVYLCPCELNLSFALFCFCDLNMDRFAVFYYANTIFCYLKHFEFFQGLPKRRSFEPFIYVYIYMYSLTEKVVNQF